MLNRLTLSGRLEDDPMIRRSGKTDYGYFHVAQECTWIDAKGQRRSRLSSFRAVCFGSVARTLHRLRRGDRVTLTGWLQSRRKPRLDRSLPPLEIVFSEYEHRHLAPVKDLDATLPTLGTVSTNSVTVVGEVVRPAIRTKLDDREAPHLLIENKVRWRDRRRGWRERSTWLRVVGFDRIAHELEFVRKGHVIAVSGRLQARTVGGGQEPWKTLHELVAGEVDYLSFGGRQAA